MRKLERTTLASELPGATWPIENDDVVYVSAATIWELTIKSMLGKLKVNRNPKACWSVRASRSCRLPHSTRRESHDFPELLRHDPLDRLLIAQAKLERLDLLTADKVLLARGYGFVVDATS